MSLDFAFPHGHSRAVFCRWCRNRRTILETGAVVCRVCDGVLSPATEKTPQERP